MIDFNLNRQIPRSAKPIIRKYSGNWVCFVRPGVTDRRSADTARTWCVIANKKPAS